MDIDALTDDDRKQLAKDLAAELDTGLYGNRAVLSRRQLFTLAGGSAGVAGLVALGVDPATAQSAAGQVGTEASPEDVFAFDLAVQNGAEFNGNDVTGVGALSTTSETIENRSNYPLGVGDDARVIYNSGDDNNNGRGIRTLTAAETVGTSTTELASNILNTFVAFVSGTDGSSNRFVDRISGSAFDGVSQTELHIRNSPASRSYSENSGALELAMGSGSYNVSIWILRFDTI